MTEDISIQEKILRKYCSFQSVHDCFTLLRLENQALQLQNTMYFNANEIRRSGLLEIYEQIDAIKAKYPDIDK